MKKFSGNHITKPTTAMEISSPSPIGFEGFEKRLEIAFSATPPFSKIAQLGLRALTRSQLDKILEAACCTIVSHLSNTELDSYVLSESSLFVYPLKIILKTCGTTKLLLSVQPIVELGGSLGLSVSSVKYSRGSFIFPQHQPSPHCSFTEEVTVLNEHFGGLISEAYVIGDPSEPNRNWHVYSAVTKSKSHRNDQRNGSISLEMCMTGLDREKAAVFYQKHGESLSSANEMTKMSGISNIIPGHVLCDFEFEPCGYSMNGIEGEAYSTVHVTPEDGFSYASYEATGLDPGSIGLEPLVKRVLCSFGPREFSLAVTCGSEAQWLAMNSADMEGYMVENVLVRELPGGECLVYRTYSMADKWTVSTPWANVYTMQCWKEAADVEEDTCGGVLSLHLLGLG